MNPAIFTRLLIALLFVAPYLAIAQSSLTIDYIMRDNWIGHFPSNINWSEDSKHVYFSWNPERNLGDSLYRVAATGTAVEKVPLANRLSLPSTFGSYSEDFSKMVYVKNGDLYLLDIKTNKTTQLTNTLQAISGARFHDKDTKVVFSMNQNLYTLDLTNMALRQVTNFVRGTEKKDSTVPSVDNEKWLYNDQLAWIEILQKRKEEKDARDAQRKLIEAKRPLAIYTGTKNINHMTLSPDGRYVVYQLVKMPENNQPNVPNYVTETGYTDNIRTRVKVGSPQPQYECWIYDSQTDKNYQVKTANITGIKDLPDYTRDYPEKKWEEKERGVIFFAPKWNKDGSQMVMEIRSQDNKDRWFVSMDASNANYNVIERQRDEAWIGGPGLGNFGGGNTWGWMPDQQRIWFQSEESGYSHLYTLNVRSGLKKTLTSGKFEVYSPQISRDNKKWYFSSNEVHYGERHFYSMPIEGGGRTKITSMEGSNNVSLSPDEKYIAYLYSNATTPWELYIQENKPNAQARKITESRTEEFRKYAWRTPLLVEVPASDGAKVPARLYKPATDKANGAAVIFVHGAGYLQNAHKWWSSYFREYMFHNMLTDMGYTVLDIDYRASAGYGRDWRTAIYRHMGGKDLSDHVDGAKYLVDAHGVDAKKIGIYGGSYGGFITLMALFKHPGVFTAGAALRSVTDWAHYNHGYTSNILNEPQYDSLAYVRSSPIYYADGLQDHLLIAHGMIDTNVHFQDVVRLAQRLIELRKDNWEFAVYPLEDHGFVEETSWADEYKRILKLFEERLR